MGETKLLKVENRRFDRKVREALEIQFQETSPRNDHGLNQDELCITKLVILYGRNFLDIKKI